MNSINPSESYNPSWPTQLSQDEIDLVAGGNAQDTVTGSFVSNQGQACISTPIDINGRNVKLCITYYR